MKKLCRRPFPELVAIALLTTLLIQVGCASKQVNERAQTKPTYSDLNKLSVKILPIIPYEETQKKISKFRNHLQAGKPISLEAWQLHDELLEIYTLLKERAGFSIKVPAKSKINITLKSFCLDSSKASPVVNEIFAWKKDKPNIPYYRELLDYWHQHQRIPQSDIQTVLWNLGNKTNFEDYPDHLRSILLNIDPRAPTKLPSHTKSRTTEIIHDWLESTVPGVSTAKEAIEWAQGQFRDYSQVASDISKLFSRYPIPANPAPQPVEGTALYAETQSKGFSTQEVTFYNPTDNDDIIDFRNYYLAPERSDVQHIGLTPESSSGLSLLPDLEKVLYDDMARLGIGFVPVANDIADLFELVSGKDFISGRTLSGTERLLSGVGLIIGSGVNYRWAQRAMAAPERMLPKFEKGFEQASGRSLSRSEQAEAGGFLRNSEIAVSDLKKSPTLNRLAERPSASKANFYVRPDGELIPARGYRYVRSDASYVREMVRNGRLPANPKRNYISFNDYSNQAVAKKRLQVSHDARYKVEFDTKQVIDDIEVPRGKWGEADYLEPITRDYPQFGEGGATQAVTSKPINANRIIDLKTGRIVFENPR